LGVALLGRRDQRRVDDLSAHGEVAALLQLPVEVGEQRLERAGLGELLAEQPDRIGVGRRRPQIEAEKPQPAQPIADQIFHPGVADGVLRRQDQHLQHRHRIVRRSSTLRAVAIGQRGGQRRPETLKIHDPAQLLQRVAMS